MSFSEPDQLHREFSEALRRRNVDALLAMYEQDAVRLQQDGSVSDDAAVRRALFEELTSGPAMPDVSQRITIVSGELALTSTTYAFAGQNGDTTSMTTAEVSRRQTDGRWRVVIDAPSFLTK